MKTLVPKPLPIVVVLALLLAGTASAGGPQPQINIATAGAPNAYGSPTWNSWAQNAIYEIATEGPASFEDHPVVGPGYFVVAGGFHSWLGKANPGAVFGPAYAGELGTRMHWVTRVTSKSGKIDIADGLAFRLEPNGFWPTVIGYTVTQYTPYRVGLDYGPDGQKGTPDDGLLTAGTGAVDEIVLLVPGLAYAVYDYSGDLAQQQVALDAAYAFVDSFGVLQFRACASFAGGKETCHNLLLNGSAKGHGVTGLPVSVSPSHITGP